MNAMAKNVGLWVFRLIMSLPAERARLAAFLNDGIAPLWEPLLDPETSLLDPAVVTGILSGAAQHLRGEEVDVPAAGAYDGPRMVRMATNLAGIASGIIAHHFDAANDAELRDLTAQLLADLISTIGA